MTTTNALAWNRESTKSSWNGQDIVAPAGLLWAAELPDHSHCAIVTLFDENTPRDVPNGFIYKDGNTFQPLKIQEGGNLIRFLGCYTERDNIVFNATNNTEYLLNPTTCEVLSSRYYR
jgi:hypothetical protein